MEVDGDFSPQVVSILEKMTSSVAETRKSVQSLLQKQGTEQFDIKDGISLLSVKNQVMINYLHALALLSAQRILNHSITERSPPSTSFQNSNRQARGEDAGDLVDSLIESRLVLEKSKGLQSRMNYQIEKLIRAATEPETSNEIDDPLSFRPNPDNLVQNEEAQNSELEQDDHDGIYRPPKVAPMPYSETNGKEKRRGKVPAALASLQYETINGPHAESTSGLGGAGNRGVNAMSARARELARMNEYEETNMTRLVMNKKEAKRRRQDEETIALGGSGMGPLNNRGKSRGVGLADEFGDLLRAREKRKGMVDDYAELRARSKKKDAFERSKTRERDEHIDVDGGERPRKRSRFHQEVKKSKRRQK